MKDFHYGRALGTSFSLYFKRLPVYFLITLVIFLPMVAATIWVRVSPPTDLATAGYMAIGVLLLTMMLYPLAAGSVVFAVFNDMRGKSVGVGESLGAGFSRLLPVIGVGLVTGILVVIGLVLFVIPGLVVMGIYYVAVPAAVIENLGVGAAMSRSKALTKDFVKHTASIPIGLGILGWIIAFVFKKAGLGSLWYLEIVINLVLNGVGAVSMVVAYQQLREIKDGSSAEELASVFD